MTPMRGVNLVLSFHAALKRCSTENRLRRQAFQRLEKDLFILGCSGCRDSQRDGVSVAGFRSLPALICEFDGSSVAFGWFYGSALGQKV